MKKLFSINGNSQKLDGGAMFGNAPKAMWQKWVEVDEENRIDLACRALLVKQSDPVVGKSRNILFELGIGAFFEPKLKHRFGIVESHHVLLESLEKHGLTHEDIDVLVLSHLHFDHIGGLLSEWKEGEDPHLLFPNAAILVGKEAWERALNPHYRDRASFVPHLMSLLQARDNVHIVDGDSHPILGDDYRFYYSNGHTPGMMLAEVLMPDGPVVFCADLIPGVPWVHLPITMGYDRYAELLIDEKETLLTQLIERKARLFFTHDSEVAMGRLAKNDKGKFCVSDTQTDLDGVSE
ncbi:MBL fold metallo-hydrolase [Aliikangiella coralliicola]|uniref:MBL fold metallo-hydrolase n=1 Tax=Aliikangiella coralliicola TaxID=2592383 RepID=A0A545U5Z7_9GAMM|nr:MBL fold metallo-hydrolase [Aliikangiella coralliicola]TQV84891.1 MBL fold metallo-hydrolase [Aliikangiella coralliicola]